ncbi:DUF6891 domain-containing protein [Methanobrevibacter arboriphilus]|uniref:DUF6891 domain-containing protein n=1 Tax=Methanobrevibacter arboriphilus TaxID=39441 RepID=UPI000AF899E0|nr:hypothetical protein [Methanobrevibacter arboriphilus]
MDKELIQEINYEISILIDSGFYYNDEILEIIEEQFIDEDIPLDILNNMILDRYNENISKQKDWEEKKLTLIDLESVLIRLIKKR